MRNIQGTFETRKRPFICAFSICMTVPLRLNVSNVNSCILSLIKKNLTYAKLESKVGNAYSCIFYFIGKKETCFCCFKVKCSSHVQSHFLHFILLKKRKKKIIYSTTTNKLHNSEFPSFCLSMLTE